MWREQPVRALESELAGRPADRGDTEFPLVESAAQVTDVLSVLPILSKLAGRRGVDFRDHRRVTTERGLRARLVATGCSNLAAYMQLLDRSDDEIDRLLESLVIPVSQFFRDAEVFAALENVVIPDVLAPRLDRVRVWVAGTATGEEAWSLAMLFAGLQPRGGRDADILASDVDDQSLATAVAGRYPARARDDTPPRFHDYLHRDGTDVLVADQLRRRVLFAHHDLMGPRLAPAEAILASFHFISLRNVLIYFDRRLQRKALDRLRAVLSPGGVLLLGQVETLPREIEDAFEAYPGLDPALRIYRSVG